MDRTQERPDEEVPALPGAVSELAGLCPTCRATLVDGKCRDCGGDLDSVKVGVAHPATSGAMKAEPVTVLPSRRVAQDPDLPPPEPQPVELPLPPPPSTQPGSAHVGVGTHRTFDLTQHRDETCFGRVSPTDHHVPAPIAQEMQQARAERAEAAARLEAVLPLPKEERLPAALWGGAAYLLFAFVFLAFGGTLQAAPVAFVGAALASYALVSRPSMQLGLGLFAGCGVLVLSLGTFGFTLAVAILLLSALSGGFAGHLLHEQRALLTAAPDDPRFERARARGRTFAADIARGKAILAGAGALAAAWTPAAVVTRDPGEQGIFVLFPVALGAVAVTWLLGNTAHEEDRDAAAKRGLAAFGVVAAILVLSYLKRGPVLGLLGVAATLAAGWFIGGWLPALPPRVPEPERPPARF